MEDRTGHGSCNANPVSGHAPEGKKFGFSFFNQLHCSYIPSLAEPKQLGMVLLHLLPLWHHLQGWFHLPKMHKAEEANMNLGYLNQLEELTVTKYQWTNKMPTKEHEKTHLQLPGKALLPVANAHWRAGVWQIQMWRKSSCTGDSGWEKSKDAIKYWHEFSALAKERWDGSPHNHSCIFLSPTHWHPFTDPANLRSRCVQGPHVVSFSWLMVCSPLSLRTTLKTQIHQAQRNWSLPRELLTAQCKLPMKHSEPAS